MTEEVRRTFPKKPAPGTPFRSPIPKFKKDQERWERERKEMKRSENKLEYNVHKKSESTSVSGRYFEAGHKEQERKKIIEERRANKKLMKEEGRKAKMELKMKKRDVNKAKKEDRKRKGDNDKGGKDKKKIVKKCKPSVPSEESDDPESEEEEVKEIKKETKSLPHLGDSDIDSDDLPEDDMYGNEKEEEVDGDESENGEMEMNEEEEGEDREEEEGEDEESDGETVPLASTRVNKYFEKEEDDEDEDEEEEEQDDEEEEEEPEEEETGPSLTDLEKFREEMASLPLSKVREVKEKLGIKLFNDAFFGKVEKKEEEAVEGPSTKKVFKRENNKRPREVSSKKGSSKFRPIYNEKKKRRVDPRFDDRCGAFNEVIYDTNYGFLDEMRTDEVKKMKKDVLKAKKEGDGETVAKLREEIIREENRQKAKREKEMRMSTMKELKKENIERMKKGLQPKFVKRSEVKMKIMEKKFDQLKEDNQLDKYLRRKAKKESRKGSSGKGVGPKLGVGRIN